MTTSPAPALGLAALALLTLGACASTNVIAVGNPRDLAGTWRGLASGPLGRGFATLTIAEDGGYGGKIFLDGEERSFAGAIVVVAPGRARYLGSEGHGSVTLTERGGQTRLRFVHDGGGGGGTFERAP